MDAAKPLAVAFRFGGFSTGVLVEAIPDAFLTGVLFHKVALHLLQTC